MSYKINFNNIANLNIIIKHLAIRENTTIKYYIEYVKLNDLDFTNFLKTKASKYNSLI